jgi:hypothetical protein
MDDGNFTGEHLLAEARRDTATVAMRIMAAVVLAVAVNYGTNILFILAVCCVLASGSAQAQAGVHHPISLLPRVVSRLTPMSTSTTKERMPCFHHVRCLSFMTSVNW